MVTIVVIAVTSLLISIVIIIGVMLIMIVIINLKGRPDHLSWGFEISRFRLQSLGVHLSRVVDFVLQLAASC